MYRQIHSVGHQLYSTDRSHTMAAGAFTSETGRTTGRMAEDLVRMLSIFVQRVVMSCIGYGLMAATWAASFTTQSILYLCLWPFMSERDLLLLLGWVFRYYSSFVVHFTPWWSLRVLGPPPPPLKRTIVVCNHLSNGDAFFLSSALLPYETKWIAKASLFDVPFGGWSMRLAGDLPVHFTKDKDGWGLKKGSVGAMMKKCRYYLHLGIPLAVFPEGGRSSNGTPLPFKDGFFKLALETEATIQPCAMSGSERAWPVHHKLFAPATIFVRFGEPISAEGHSVESLRDATYKTITELMTALPPPKVA